MTANLQGGRRKNRFMDTATRTNNVVERYQRGLVTRLLDGCESNNWIVVVHQIVPLCYFVEFLSSILGSWNYLQFAFMYHESD